MLLSYEKYQALGGTAPEEKYPKLEQDAEDLFNARTSFFYVTVDIDQDPDQERANFFRKALTLQINYTNDIGASTMYEMSEKDIKTISIDGTSISKGTNPLSYVHNGVYALAYDYLYRTGLLYRGVQHC